MLPVAPPSNPSPQPSITTGTYLLRTPVTLWIINYIYCISEGSTAESPAGTSNKKGPSQLSASPSFQPGQIIEPSHTHESKTLETFARPPSSEKINPSGARSSSAQPDRPEHEKFKQSTPTTSAFGNPSIDTFEKQSANTFGNPSTSPFGNQSTNTFGNPSTSQFGNPSTNTFGNPFGNPSASQFGNPSTTTFGNPSPGLFGNAFGNRSNSPSGRPSTSPLGGSFNPNVSEHKKSFPSTKRTGRDLQ